MRLNTAVKSLSFRISRIAATPFVLTTPLVQARQRMRGMLLGVWGRRAGEARTPTRDAHQRDHLCHVLSRHGCLVI
jgi:hypothetical protein